MNIVSELTLQSLREKYADRKPNVLSESQIGIHSVIPQSAGLKHHAFVSLSITAGIVMFATVSMMINVPTKALQSHSSKVLGTSTNMVETDFAGRPLSDAYELAQSLNAEFKESDSEDFSNQYVGVEIETTTESTEQSLVQNIINAAQKNESSLKNEPQMIMILPVPGDWVNYRAEAGDDSRILGRVPSGSHYEMVSEQDGWIQIKLDDEKLVWVSADLVEKI